MAELADRTRAEAENARRWNVVQRLAEHGDWLLWAVLPQLALLLVGPEGIGASRRVVADGRNAGRAFVRRRGPTLIRVGTVLFASTSGQNLRVLEPIARALEANHGPRTIVRLPRLSPRRFTDARRQASRLTRQLRTQLAERRCSFPPAMYEEIVQTAVLGARSELLMAAEPPEMLVVGTQHNSATRAMLAAAHSRSGIRTVYVPHAPVASNPAYRDLPVHHALVRGPAEIDFYTAIGAGGSRLAVVGDPSISPPPRELPPMEGPVVFAAPTLPEVEFAEVIRVIAHAGLGPVEVAPHPLKDTVALRALCPPDWTFNAGRSTYDRLVAQGATAVIHSDSGVGLEALALGLPVVNVLPPGKPPNYPYLTSPLVAVAHDSDALRRAVAEADRSPSAVTERQRFARSWSARAGIDAARSSCSAIDDLLEHEPVVSLILDGWGVQDRAAHG